jgi:DNA polymerase-3 subunit delta'
VLFKDCIGQVEIKKQLVQLIRANHLPHAIMLQGAEGSGALPIALATAQYIVCQNKQADEPCNECNACAKASILQHPDIKFSFPVYNNTKDPVTSDSFIKEFRNYVLKNPYGNAIDWLQEAGSENKQGNITALECREVIKKLQLRSFESEYKVLIMWSPEYLGKEGNILLKQIEEPTAKTIMIFVADNLENVLGTIKSRTQLFPLRRLQTQEIVDALINNGAEKKAAMQAAMLSEGNYNIAQKYVAEGNNDLIRYFSTWMNVLINDKAIELIAWIETMTEETKETIKQFFQYSIHLFEYYIRFKNVQNNNLILSDTEMKVIEAFSKKNISALQVNNITTILNENIYYIERNAHMKQLLHASSLKIQEELVAKN